MNTNRHEFREIVAAVCDRRRQLRSHRCSQSDATRELQTGAAEASSYQHLCPSVVKEQ